MDRRRSLMSANRQTTAGQFVLWEIVDVTEYERYDTSEGFINKYLRDFLNEYENVSVYCDFKNNTNNTRAAIWFTYFKTTRGNDEGGRRVGDVFGGSYGADLYAGAQIYIYYSVLNLL